MPLAICEGLGALPFSQFAPGQQLEPTSERWHWPERRWCTVTKRLDDLRAKELTTPFQFPEKGCLACAGSTENSGERTAGLLSSPCPRKRLLECCER